MAKKRIRLTEEERKARRRERLIGSRKKLASLTEEELEARVKLQLKNNSLKAHYGISLVDYNGMLKNQDGCCAVCKSDKPGGFGLYFDVDHCAKTRRVRRLLCHRCNLGLGYFKHDIRLLQMAIDYLMEF